MELPCSAIHAATTNQPDIELVCQPHLSGIDEVLHAARSAAHFTSTFKSRVHRRRDNAIRMVIEKLLCMRDCPGFESDADVAVAGDLICRLVVTALRPANCSVGVFCSTRVDQDFHIFHYRSIWEGEHFPTLDAKNALAGVRDIVLSIAGADLEPRGQRVDHTSSHRVTVARTRQIAPGGNENKANDDDRQYPGNNAHYPVQAQPLQLHR